MALPDLAALRAFLREPPASANTQLTEALADAKAMVGGFLGRPIEAISRTFPRLRPVWSETEETEMLQLPDAPIASGGLVVTDSNGGTINAANYEADLARGWLYAKSGIGLVWSTTPYTVAASVGLVHHPDYLTRIEPVLRAAILEVAGDLYLRKNSAIQSESGGGVSVSYGASGMPIRTEENLKPWRRAPRV